MFWWNSYNVFNDLLICFQVVGVPLALECLPLFCGDTRANVYYYWLKQCKASRFLLVCKASLVGDKKQLREGPWPLPESRPVPFLTMSSEPTSHKWVGSLHRKYHHLWGRSLNTPTPIRTLNHASTRKASGLLRPIWREHPLGSRRRQELTGNPCGCKDISEIMQWKL